MTDPRAGSGPYHHEDPRRYDGDYLRAGAPFATGSDPGDCRMCAPFPCDDPDRHLGVPSEYTPLANAGCHCGADLDGRDCMCFEDR
jgi:hypothetical protein